MKMELHQLECFLAVAVELHFGNAARKLHMSQPPLSMHIKHLEERIGARLLNRTKRTVSLTPAGRFFYEKAAPLMKELQNVADMAHRIELGHAGRLVIGYTGSMAHTVMPPILMSFTEEASNCWVDLRQLGIPEQLHALKNGDIDIGFVRPPISDPHIHVERLLKEPMVVAMPAKDRLARQKTLTLKSLRDAPFIIPPSGALFGLIKKSCHDEGFDPRIIQEAGEIQTIIGLVSSGLGISLVPSSCRRVQMPNVVYRPLLRSPIAETVLAWKKGAQSPLLGSFVKIAKRASSVLHEKSSRGTRRSDRVRRPGQED